MSESEVDNLLSKAFEQQFGDSWVLNQLFNEKLKDYGLSKSKAATILGIDKSTLSDYLSGEVRQPTLINIIKLANFIDISINDLVIQIIKTQSVENIASIERAKNASFIAKYFNIKKLKSIGFFSSTNDVEYLMNRILSFFGYENILDFEKKLNAPLFSKSKRTFSDKMRDFWIQSAYQCFVNINNPNEFNREALKDIVVKIKPHCQDVKGGLFTVCKALYNAGVTVIVQNQLTGTQVRGGTFIINDKPHIVLTDLNKRYTTIWETLIHELHHVLFDQEIIRTINFHLTGEPDLFLIEEKADEFAMEYYCGFDRYNFIKPQINNRFIVTKYAKDWEIDPSFIYSSFRYFQKKLHNENYYAAFSEYFPNISMAIKNLHPITWKENSIPEIAERIKTIFELNTIHYEKA